MSAPTIGFICGSLRDGSINQMLKNTLKKRVKAAGGKVTEVSLATYNLPLFHGDLDMPANVKKLANKMKKCDGIIVVTPEYNGCLPPLLKNAIDWTSTTGTDQFTQPVYGIASCSPGPMSGIMCLRQLHYILNRVGAHVVPTHVGVGKASQAFDAKGGLIIEPSSSLADKMIGELMTQIAQKG
ncbi:NADPH-dependent FMN reductase [Fretibacter rubidus]|uniref:NADPH-dependent FMN reductase n=1 Tax=Fretibacter rubidus TaxID=570162 RepID=UPI00352A6852